MVAFQHLPKLAWKDYVGKLVVVIPKELRNGGGAFNSVRADIILIDDEIVLSDYVITEPTIVGQIKHRIGDKVIGRVENEGYRRGPYILDEPFDEELYRANYFLDKKGTFVGIT